MKRNEKVRLTKWLVLGLRRWLTFLPENPVALTFFVFMGLTAFTIIVSLPYYGKEEFNINLASELHGVLLDILIIGILIFWLNIYADTRKSIRSYLQEIDDFRHWKSEESIFRTVGNIKRLNKLKVVQLNLSFCFLENANLNYVKLQRSNLNYANLTGASLHEINFEDAFLNQTSLKDSKIQNANFVNARLSGTNFENATILKSDFDDAYMIVTNLCNAQFIECDLKGVDFHGANTQNTVFYKCDLRKTSGLTVEQLLAAKNFTSSILDEELKELLVKAQKPLTV